MARWFLCNSIERSLECQNENLKSQYMLNILTSKTDSSCQVEGAWKTVRGGLGRSSWGGRLLGPCMSSIMKSWD